MEEFARLVDLVGLREDSAQFVQHLGLLIEVRRHLEHANQRTDCIVVGFEALVEDADAVPELRIVHVFYGVEGVLVSSERLVNVLC